MRTPIARGQSAQLELDGHGRWSVIVEATMPGRLAVAALASPPAERSALPGAQARLAVATPRGLVRTTGVVLAADPSGLFEIDLTAEPQVEQRRSHVRVAALLPGLVHPADGGHQPLHTYTLDVSGGGVLVAGAGPADVGAAVEITVKLPERDPLRTDGRIARRTREGHVALAFDGIDDDAREQLVRWIFERQRRDRHEAREI